MTPEHAGATPQSPQVDAFFHEPSSSLSYLVWDEATLEAAVIDPVLDFDAASACTGTATVDRLVDRALERGLQVRWILETHAHADHLSAAAAVRARLGGTTAIGAGIQAVQRHFKDVYRLERGFLPDGSCFGHLLEDGEPFAVGAIAARAIATPGHTPDHMSYLIGDALFVGDTLFMPDGGTARCDFPGGDAGTLYRSIGRLFSLPPETRMFVLHDYRPNGRELRWQTSIADQRRMNIHVGAGRSPEEFVALRERRDATLDLPSLIIASVQVNIRAGELPPEEDGTRYLTVPLNRAGAFSQTVA